MRPPQGNLGTDGNGVFVDGGNLGGIDLAADFNGTQFATISHAAELGDVNFDGQVNGLDVDPFVDTLVNGPDLAVADMNQDGAVNGLDVDPFVAAVVGGGTRTQSAAIPEPASGTLLIIAGLAGIAVGCSRSHRAGRGRDGPRLNGTVHRR